jgi:hypothetical protein
MGNGNIYPYNSNGKLFEDVVGDYANVLLAYLSVYNQTSLVEVILHIIFIEPTLC